MATKAPSMDLATAWVNCDAVHFSFSKSRKQKLFLNGQLQITKDVGNRAPAITLVDQVAKHFLLSQDHDRFTKTLRIFSMFEEMEPSADLTTRVKTVRGLLEKKRAEEIPRHLALLVELRRLAHDVSDYVEAAIVSMQSQKMYKEYCEPIVDAGVTKGHLLKKTPTKEELAQFMSSPNGHAFLCRFARLLQEDRPFVLDNFPEEDFQILQKFVTKSGFASDHFASVLLEFIKCTKAQETSKVKEKQFIATCGTIGQYYDTPSMAVLINKAFPSLLPFFNFFSKRVHGLDTKTVNRATYEFILNLHRRGQELPSDNPCLYSCYDAWYKEYVALTTTRPLGLPTPEEFDKLPIGFQPRDLSKEIAPEVLFPSPSPTPTSSLATQPTQPVVRSFTPPAPKKEKREEKEDRAKSAPTLPTEVASSIIKADKYEKKEARVLFRSIAKDEGKEAEKPKAVSLFANRKFPYAKIEYTPRVNEWLAISKEEYARASEKRQRSIWKHAFRHVDHFLGTSYCRSGTWVNPDTKQREPAFRIHGEVVWKGVPYPGVFQYTWGRDKDGVEKCFHRHFGKKSDIELLDMIFAEQMYSEVDYPSLQKSLAAFKANDKGVHTVIPGEIPCEIDELGTAVFRDEDHDITIRLHRLGGR